MTTPRCAHQWDYKAAGGSPAEPGGTAVPKRDSAAQQQSCNLPGGLCQGNTPGQARSLLALASLFWLLLSMSLVCPSHLKQDSRCALIFTLLCIILHYDAPGRLLPRDMNPRLPLEVH